jgi:hypothetical protein
VFEQNSMNVQEVRGAHPLEVRSSFNRELHGVDVGKDLCGARADVAAGPLVGLGPSKTPRIHLHALDLRRRADSAGANL